MVVAAVGVYFLYSNLGTLVKAAIERYGSQATQAQVRVDSVTLSLTSGSGAISGVVIGNPAGFSTPSAFELGTISLQLDIATLNQTPVVIKEIVIAAPRITYERGASTGNLETIRDNVRRYAGADAAGAPSRPSSGSAPSDGETRKVVIENLYVRDGQVAVTATALQGRTLSSRLPAIHLRDIGKDKGGATPVEVAQRVIGAIADEAAKTGLADLNRTVRELGGAVQEQIERAAPGLGDRLRGVIPGRGN
jgi:uncharacterized protein involved in outer membrane biogenesis